MRVAVFTDNDFDKVNGVTTALRAVLQCAPADISPRIYTASTLAVDQPDYLALAAAGVPIPFYGEMKIYWPSLVRAGAPHPARQDRVDPSDHTGPAGPGGALGVEAERAADGWIVPHRSRGLHRHAERLAAPRALHGTLPALDVRSVAEPFSPPLTRRGAC